MKVYGYVRVSTKEQNEARQVMALSNYEINPCNIFIDKQSGKDFERKGYSRLLKRLKKGDILVIKSIDRMGRNYKEIIEQWYLITQVKKADIVVLDMPLLDTTRNKDLFGTFISDLVLQILSFVAENERINIKQRQAEGIAIAKEKGVKFGRPLKYDENEVELLLERVVRGELKRTQVMEILNISKTTYHRLKNEHCKKDVS